MSTNVGAIHYDLSLNTAKFYSSAAKVNAKVSSVSDVFSGFGSKIATVGKIAAVVMGSVATVAMAKFVDQASELQSVRASFESMTGSAQKASNVLQQLNKFSFETAFSSEAINKSAQLLLGAGLATEQLGDTMKWVGDVAGATGADLGMLTLPLSQAFARGKLQTQDFYQILNSGAGKFGQLLREEVVNRGMGDFQEAMENGLVTTEILWDTLKKASSEGGFAFQGAIKQADTYAGRMSNLWETISNVGMAILGVDKATGEVDPEGIFARMSNAVKDTTAWLDMHKQTIISVINIIVGGLGSAISFISGVIKSMVDWFNANLLPTIIQIWTWLSVNLFPILSDIARFVGGYLS